MVITRFCLQHSYLKTGAYTVYFSGAKIWAPSNGWGGGERIKKKGYREKGRGKGKKRKREKEKKGKGERGIKKEKERICFYLIVLAQTGREKGRKDLFAHFSSSSVLQYKCTVLQPC